MGNSSKILKETNSSIDQKPYQDSQQTESGVMGDTVGSLPQNTDSKYSIGKGEVRTARSLLKNPEGFNHVTDNHN